MLAWAFSPRTEQSHEQLNRKEYVELSAREKVDGIGDVFHQEQMQAAVFISTRSESGRKQHVQLLYERLSNDLAAEISKGLESFQTNVRNQQEALDSLDVRAHILEWLRRRREMTQGQEDTGTLELIPVVLSESKNAAILQPPEIIRTEKDEEECDCADFIRRLYKSLHNDAVMALRDGEGVDFSPDSSIVLG